MNRMEELVNSFEEIIPASDRLSEELSFIKGGNGITCDDGAMCKVGEIELT